MRKQILIILFLVVAAYFSYSSTAQWSPRIIYVEQNGAIGDGVANDVIAIQKTLAQASANGGKAIVRFAAGKTYLVSLGDPASDSNLTTGLGGFKVAFYITASDITLELEAGSQLKAVSSHLYQNCASSTAPNYTNLFQINNSVARTRFLGPGKITFELTGGAAYCNVENGVDGFTPFYAPAGSYIETNNRLTVDGFPQGPYLGGDSVANGAGQTEELGYHILKNSRFLNWGFSGHNRFAYIWGRAIIDGNDFITTNTFASHAIYTGSDKPDTRITNNYFKGILSTTGEKFPIHVYATSHCGSCLGTIRDYLISGNVFDGNWQGILLRKDDGTAFSEHVVISNNSFRGSTAAGAILGGAAFTFHRPRNVILSNNTVYNYTYGVNVVGSYNAFTVSNNTFDGVKFPINTDNSGTKNGAVYTANTIRNIPASGIGIVAGASDDIISNNNIEMGTNASVIGISGVNGLSPINLSIIDNIIFGAGLSSQTGISINYGAAGTVTCASVTGNKIRFTTAGNPLGITGNTTGVVSDLSVIGNDFITASGTAISVANLTTSTGYFERNNFVGTISVGSVMTATFRNNIFNGTLSVTTGMYNRGNNTVGGNYEFITPAAGASFIPNAGIYNVFNYTFNANGTIDNPIQGLNGQVIEVNVTQDATGGRTLTLGSEYPSAATLNCIKAGVAQANIDTTLSTKSKMFFKRNAAATKWEQVGVCTTGLTP